MKRTMLMLLVLLLAAGLAAAEGMLLPSVPRAEEAQLSEAANAPQGDLAFHNPEDPMIWPMLPAEEDGFSCLTSANWGVDNSVSAVYALVEAQAGDALTFWYKTSCETGFDLMQVCVDGEVVKVFTGERAWAQYTVAFPAAGVYEVSFRYSKDTVAAAGSDAAYVRDVQLLTGDAAAQALAANPVYPAGTQRTLTVATEAAREIEFSDPTFALTALNGLAKYYIVDDEEVRLHATLAAGDDPDGAVIRAGEAYAVASGAAQDGYDFTFPLTQWSVFTLVPCVDSGLMDACTVVCFPSETAADQYLAMLQASGYPVDMWRYAGLTACEITVIDQHGEFLPGVEISLQTWEGVAPLVSDAEGRIAFAVSPGETAVVRIVGAPEGYTFDPERLWILDAATPAAIIDVTRNEE
ncbi:MAG: hypothetical protein IJE07_10220 [Clostridia bacterium]|nr:hypothetical protein [Clostridia bacterium]